MPSPKRSVPARKPRNARPTAEESFPRDLRDRRLRLSRFGRERAVAAFVASASETEELARMLRADVAKIRESEPLGMLAVRADIAQDLGKLAESLSRWVEWAELGAFPVVADGAR